MGFGEFFSMEKGFKSAMTTRQAVLHTNNFRICSEIPASWHWSVLIKILFQKVDDAPSLIIYNSEIPLQALRILQNLARAFCRLWWWYKKITTTKVKGLFVQIIIHLIYSLQRWAEFKLVLFYLHDLVDEFHYHFYFVLSLYVWLLRVRIELIRESNSHYKHNR